MAQTRTLKTRIKAVRSTRQITKAMELVAASKMRRAQEAAFKSRDYRDLALEILTRLSQLTDIYKHPLYVKRKLKTRLHIVITSDRGLAGAYNSNVLKQLARELIQDKQSGIVSKIIVEGKQGFKFASSLKDVEIVAAYQDFPDSPTANDLRPVLNTIIEQFTNRQVDAVDILFTDYISSIVQTVKSQRLLPAGFDEVSTTNNLDDALFEPSVREVLDNITARLIEAQLNQAFVEAAASEHSMRMMAMKSATDNANDLIDDLTLAFNTARQSAITQELAEITGGAEAMK